MSRLENAVLYVALKSLELKGECVQKTNLNKILFYADLEFYKKHSESITGIEYIRQPHGPVPAGMDWVLEECENKNLIRIQEKNMFGKTAMLVDPRVTRLPMDFSAEEKKILDKCVEEFTDKTAGYVSELSHEEIDIWKILPNGSKMPLICCLAKTVKPTKEELSWINAQIKKNKELYL